MIYTEDQKKKRNEARKRWSKNNPDKVRARKLIWNANNKEKIKEYKKREWQKNKETYKKYRLEHKEQLNGWKRKYYHKNKEHINQQRKTYLTEHPERSLRYRNTYRNKNRAGVILSIVKRECKERNIVTNIDREWIQTRLDSGVCELSGIAFDMVGKRTPNSPSIDRINPRGGYTIDNCRMITWSLNRAFSNLGEQYFLDIFEKILRKRKPEIFSGSSRT